MSTRLYVGDLSFKTTRHELQDLFSKAGFVREATVVQDRETGKSRGFAFVIMSSNEDARSAIEKFNGREFQGRNLMVNEARLSNVRARRSRNPFVTTNAKSRSLVGFVISTKCDRKREPTH